MTRRDRDERARPRLRGRASPRTTTRLLAAVALAVGVALAMVWILWPTVPGPPPAQVDPTGFFSQAQLDRAKGYRGPQRWLGVAHFAVGLLALTWLVRRPPRWIARRARAQGWGWVLAGASAAAAGWLVLTLAPLPVDAVARQRTLDVGLSTRVWSGWLADVALSTAIGTAYAAVGGALLVVMLRKLGHRWWIAGAALAVVFGVATTYANPILIEPRFNSFTPLSAGPVRSDVLALARRAGVDVGEVYVVDASKRTTAANAYVAGIGHTKRVVIYDTLLKAFPRDEVRHVVAHELGHVRYRDVPRGLLWLAVVAPFGAFAAARLAQRLGPETERERSAAAVPAVALSLALVLALLTTVSDGLSRPVEARADGFALTLTHDPAAMIAFQRRIAVANVSDPDPPAWARLNATHPTPLARIGAAVAFKRAAAAPRRAPAAEAAGGGRRRTQAGS